MYAYKLMKKTSKQHRPRVKLTARDLDEYDYYETMAALTLSP